MYATSLRKVGGSAMIAIPPFILNMLNLHIGEDVSLELNSSNAIVIKPLQRKKPSLNDLLAQCDASAPMPLQNAQDAQWDALRPVGNELL
jgi:mRNA interferase ChpB